MMEMMIALIAINAAIYFLIVYLLVTSLIHHDQKLLRTLLLLTGLLIVVRNAIHGLENHLRLDTLNIHYEVEQFGIALLILIFTITMRKYVLQMGQHNGKLTHLLEHDTLTNALSRFDLMKRAMNEIERSKRTGHSMALMLIDVDQFKNVNDTYGHLAGDKTLKSIVNTCQSTLREIDMLGRMGGDEFIVLLPETNLTGAEEIAKRMIQKIKESKIEIDNGTRIKVNISIGIALYQPDTFSVKDKRNESETTLKRIIARADEALYKAKKSGRANYASFYPNLQLAP